MYNYCTDVPDLKCEPARCGKCVCRDPFFNVAQKILGVYKLPGFFIDSVNRINKWSLIVAIKTPGMICMRHDWRSMLLLILG